MLYFTYSFITNLPYPTIKYNNIFTNFTLIYKQTLLLHLDAKTTLYNTITIYIAYKFLCK
jgi:hypothetical protein